ISARARSSSSRISSVARSEISVIAAAMFSGISSCSVAKTPQEQRRNQSAGERGADQYLGPLANEIEPTRRKDRGGRAAARPLGRGGSVGRARITRFGAHSGGSSSKIRRHISAAALLDAIEKRAPRPAS